VTTTDPLAAVDEEKVTVSVRTPRFTTSEPPLG
jgi:hypothetical protein